MSTIGRNIPKKGMAFGVHTSEQQRHTTPFHAMHVFVSMLNRALMQEGASRLNTSSTHATAHCSQKVHPLSLNNRLGVLFSPITIMCSSQALTHGLSTHEGHNSIKRFASKA